MTPPWQSGLLLLLQVLHLTMSSLKRRVRGFRGWALFPEGPYLAGLEVLSLGRMVDLPLTVAKATCLRILDASDISATSLEGPQIEARLQYFARALLFFSGKDDTWVSAEPPSG